MSLSLDIDTFPSHLIFSQKDISLFNSAMKYLGVRIYISTITKNQKLGEDKQRNKKTVSFIHNNNGTIANHSYSSTGSTNFIPISDQILPISLIMQLFLIFISLFVIIFLYYYYYPATVLDHPISATYRAINSNNSKESIRVLKTISHFVEYQNSSLSKLGNISPTCLKKYIDFGFALHSQPPTSFQFQSHSLFYDQPFSIQVAKLWISDPLSLTFLDFHLISDISNQSCSSHLLDQAIFEKLFYLLNNSSPWGFLKKQQLQNWISQVSKSSFPFDFSIRPQFSEADCSRFHSLFEGQEFLQDMVWHYLVDCSTHFSSSFLPFRSAINFSFELNMNIHKAVHSLSVHNPQSAFHLCKYLVPFPLYYSPVSHELGVNSSALESFQTNSNDAFLSGSIGGPVRWPIHCLSTILETCHFDPNLVSQIEPLIEQVGQFRFSQKENDILESFIFYSEIRNNPNSVHSLSRSEYSFGSLQSTLVSIIGGGFLSLSISKVYEAFQLHQAQ